MLRVSTLYEFDRFGNRVRGGRSQPQNGPTEEDRYQTQRQDAQAAALLALQPATQEHRRDLFAMNYEMVSGTGVDACVRAYVTRPAVSHEPRNDEQMPDLVFLCNGGSLLQVWRIAHDSKQQLQQPQLYLFAQMRLHGRALSVNVVPNITLLRQHDALLVSFAEARLALIAYHLPTRQFRTLSLHAYERDIYRSGYTFAAESARLVRVDPKGRCAMMAVYRDYVAFLPMRSGWMGAGAEASSSLAANDNDDGGVKKRKTLQQCPFMPSYVVSWRQLDAGMVHVIDAVFLEGMHVPTVAILYEKERTWTGRLAATKDNRGVLVLSLDLQQRLHPVIYRCDNLPYDSYRLVAVQRPLGGLLIVSNNVLIYVDQGQAPCALAVNDFVAKSTQFPIKCWSNLAPMSLEASQFLALAPDRYLMSLRNGDLFTVHLVTDGTRHVSLMRLQRLGSSVQASDGCVVDHRYVLLASRLGDSHLLRYSALDQVQQQESSQDKEKLLDDEEEWLTSAPTAGEAADLKGVKRYQLSVCDRLLHLANMTNMSMGLMEGGGKDVNAPPIRQLALCTGYTKNGSLTLLQGAITVDKVTSFSLPNVQQMWSLSVLDSNSNATQCLLLSTGTTSRVFTTAHDAIDEMTVRECDFLLDAPTLACQRYAQGIIQVSHQSVRLLDSISYKLMHEWTLPHGTFTSASLCDPFLVAVLASGQALLFQVLEQKLQFMEVQGWSEVMAVCLFKDEQGHGLWRRMEQVVEMDSLTSNAVLDGINKTEEKEVIEDEDDAIERDLYGDASDAIQTETPMESETLPFEKDETVWCAIYRNNGSLTVYSLPDLVDVFAVANLENAERVLADQPNAGIHFTSATQPPQPQQQQQNLTQILMVSLGSSVVTPFLMCRYQNGQILVYRAYRYIDTTSMDWLPAEDAAVPIPAATSVSRSRWAVRFVRETIPWILKEPLSFEGVAKLDHAMVPFHGQIQGAETGVFVPGATPLFLVVGTRNTLHAHRLHSVHPITALCPFSSHSCPMGFLYYTQHDQQLHLCHLPADLILDATVPLKQVPLKRTPLALAYHAVSECYVLATSRPNAFVPPPLPDDDPTKSRPIPALQPQTQRCAVELLRSTGQSIDYYACPEYEQILCVSSVTLRTLTGRQLFIAVGTGLIKGEEAIARGRLLLFDIVHVVAEKETPNKDRVLKLVYEEEMRGAVTVIRELQGRLVLSAGTKCFLYEHDYGTGLNAIAFHDVAIYAASLCTVKNYFAVGDIQRSLYFFGLQEDMTRLVQLSKEDGQWLHVRACEMMVDEQLLGMTVMDGEGNVQIFCYAPYHPQSLGGQRLLRRADFHLGRYVTATCRVALKGMKRDRMDLQPPLRRQHGVLYCAREGSVGVLMPISSEKRYRRLSMLQQRLFTALEHACGLHPKSYRLFRSSDAPLTGNAAKNILDGDLIFEFLQLSRPVQVDLATQIGSSVDRLIDDLLDLQVAMQVW